MLWFDPEAAADGEVMALLARSGITQLAEAATAQFIGLEARAAACAHEGGAARSR